MKAFLHNVFAFSKKPTRRRTAATAVGAEICEARTVPSAVTSALLLNSAPAGSSIRGSLGQSSTNAGGIRSSLGQSSTNAGGIRDSLGQATVSALTGTTDAGTTAVRSGTAQSGASLVASTLPASTVNDIEPNGTPSLADNFGTFGSSAVTRTLNGRVGQSGDTLDYSKFTLTAPCSVVITLGSLQQDLDLELQDGSGTRLAASVRAGTQTDSISMTLSSGTYYIKTYKGISTANSTYALTLSITPQSGNTPPGNSDPDGNYSRATARNMGSFGFGVAFPRFNSSISGGGDTQDYYRFTLTSRTTTTNISLGGLRQNLNLQLEDSTGRVLNSSTRSGMSNEYINTSLGPGTYYVRVYQGGAGATSAYNLSFQFGGFN